MKTTGPKYLISKSGRRDRPKPERSHRPDPVKSTVSPARIELCIALAVFFFAFCVRSFYLYEGSANPTFKAPIADSRTYDALARRLADGRGMTGQFFWQPLFYPLFLGVVYSFGDSSLVCTRYMQVILGCFTCVLTYFLAKRIFGRRSGILAAVMVSLYGPLIFFEAELLAAGWAAFWSVALILLFLKANDTKSLLLCFILGACGALSIITRPTFLPFFITGCLWLIFTFYRASMPKFSLGLRLVVTLASFMLIATPVAIQGYRLTGRFGILPSSGGLNLYIGNNPNAAETIIIRPGAEWESLITLPGQHRMGQDRWESQRFFFQKVREYMLSQPLDFGKGLLRKTLQLFCSREMPRNVDIYEFRRWSKFLSVLTWKARGFGFPLGLVLPIAIVGLFFRWRQIPVPVILFIFFYAASIILVFISARYRVPMVPAVCCLAAGGIPAIAKMIRLRQDKKLAVVAVCVLAVVLLSTVAGPFPEEKLNYEAEIYYGLGSYALQSQESDQAVDYFKTALRLNPDFVAAHNNLGIVLAKKGDLEKAIASYSKALELEPQYTKARINIANALILQGNPGAAIDHLQEALKMGRSSAQLHEKLGQALAQEGKFDEAIKHYSQALQINPNLAEAHYNLAVCLVRVGKFDEAIRHFSDVLRIQPNHADAHYSLGKVFAERNNIDQTVKHYRRALQLKPDWPEVLNSLAWIYATNENRQFRNSYAAIQLAQQACKLTNYQNPMILDTLAAAYAAGDRFSEAVTTAEKGLNLAESLGQDRLAERIRHRLQLYKTGKAN